MLDMTSSVEPRTQSLPTSATFDETLPLSKQFETLLRTVKTDERIDLKGLRVRLAPAHQQLYVQQLRDRGIPFQEDDPRPSWGGVEVLPDETVDPGVLLLERKPSEDTRRVSSSIDVGSASRRVKGLPHETFEEGRQRREQSAPIATANEVKGMAEHSKAFNQQRRLPTFGAERSIYGRHLQVVFDGRRIGGVTGFAAQRNLSPAARKVRRGDDGKLTVPGEGAISLDKFNSAWVRFVEEHGDLSGFTIRTTLSDPGMPNPETTEYRGVTITSLSDGPAEINDMVTSFINFTFLDSEVIEPVVEPVNEKLDDVWEYAYSTGKLLADTPAPE